jgi:lipopolysaccharide/colanic/teichoic acid biosynthesis glycosyltransferase
MSFHNPTMFDVAALSADAPRLPRPSVRDIAKDVLDRAIAFSALVAAAPAILGIAAAIKATSKGPVLFKQKRRGRDGEIIEVFKFRSMRADMEDQLCLQQTQRNDPRVTRVGDFLRRTSLDELPQLLNVLRGDMSLVGPRPHALNMTVEGLPNMLAVQGYTGRYAVKPGITGLAQVNGYRGPADTIEHLERRVHWDLEYIASRTLLLDLQIMLRTATLVLRDPNAR